MSFAASKANLLMYWLLIDVSGLADRPGATQNLSASGPIEGLRGGLGWVQQNDPVRVSLTFESVRGGIEVTGDARGLLHLSCSRCLVEFEERFERRLDEIYYFDAQVADREEGYEVQGTTLDLEPMLRDAIMLGIPANPLHKPDCRGLCPVCGADLNMIEGEHTHERIDPRWGPLKDLLQDSREA